MFHMLLLWLEKNVRCGQTAQILATAAIASLLAYRQFYSPALDLLKD